MVGPGSLTNGKLPAYVENAFELLDQPGEWYLDRSAHTVYYRPRPGENLRWSDVEAPALEKLVAGDHVHDVAFRGLTFEYATWLTPSSPEGFSEIQAGYTNTGPNGWSTQGLCQFVANGTCPYASWTREPGNVSISYGQRVEFADSTFTHLGAAGLELGDGSQDALVQGNVFTDISGNGVELGGTDLPLPPTDEDVTRFGVLGTLARVVTPDELAERAVEVVLVEAGLVRDAPVIFYFLEVQLDRLKPGRVRPTASEQM